MKIDRLLGIITILLNNKGIKAKDLSEKFEVSIRTIHRDIENICLAGIPIVTYQGGGGGISIAEGYIN
ncbi:helix-turn-helix transcriptional regulator [Anaerophilus nitritogenes]|uniref:helix-turn-helix transcriptional regulator n=1 Tax=Anaerophilus nitritogenes TaxID=2498136 RepID=UPI00101DBDA5|nr:HTH domain-containing protein [Anaerophilus nitritogenes]